MTSRAIVSGVLHKAPIEKTSKAGKAYLLATIREGNGEAVRWWKALIFGEAAGAEARRIRPGEPIAVAGEFNAEIYTPENAEPRVSFSIMVDAVLSAKRKSKDEREEGRL